MVVQEEVMIQFKRNHFDEYVGKESFCWDAIMDFRSFGSRINFCLKQLTKIKIFINIDMQIEYCLGKL